MRLFAALVILVSCAVPALAMGEVHPIEVRGTTYNVVEVKERTREKISRWNMLRLKRGEKYVRFKVLDLDEPLFVLEKDLPKKTIDEVPDYRPWSVQHPRKDFAIKSALQVGSIIGGSLISR